MKGQDTADDREGKKGKDDRNNPIEQSTTSVDPSGNPTPVGTPPPPPYDGPHGGGSKEKK